VFGQAPHPKIDAAIGVTGADLEARGIADNWLSYNGDYTGRRYTSLTQVTPQNVGQLRAQWVFHSRNPGILEVTPVVVAGITSEMQVPGNSISWTFRGTVAGNSISGSVHMGEYGEATWSAIRS